MALNHPSAWTDYLHRQMPLTAAIGAVVQTASQTSVAVDIPFSPNRNHTGTAFGGSLSVAGIISGWLLVQVRARAAGLTGVEVVIQESQCRYIRPIMSDFVVSAVWPQADPWPNVERAYRHRGRARVSVQSEILDAAGKIAVVHDGAFVLVSDA